MSFFHKYNPYKQIVPESRFTRVKRYWTELILWKKIIAVLLIVSLLGLSFPIRAYFARGERYIPYSESLQKQKIVDLDYTSSDLTDFVPTEEAIRIAINVGGGLDFDCEGSRYLSPNTINTFNCEYKNYALKKGIIASVEYDPIAYTTREEAVRSLMIASGLGSSESAVPYTDVTGDTGYIARAYEIGCLPGDRYFAPDDEISRGEMFELSDCIHTAIQSSVSDPTDTIVVAPTEIISTNPTQDPPKEVNPETNTSPETLIVVSSEVASSSRVIENKTTVIERTIETRVESPLDSLPKEPGTLLGYGIDGNITTISLSEGIFLDGNNLRVIQNPIVSTSEGVFGSAPSNPPVQNPPTNSLYPTTPMTQFQVITGGLPNPGPSQNSVNSVFGRLGTITAGVGDYTTTLVSEGMNLYFTDSRAQNALSGSLTLLQSDIDTLSGTLYYITGSGAIFLRAELDALSGSIFSLSGRVMSTENTLVSIISDITTLSGGISLMNSGITSLMSSVNATNSNLATATGNIATLFSDLALTNSFLSTATGTILSFQNTLSTATGQITSLIANLALTNGYLATATGNISTLSGILSTNINALNALSGTIGSLSGTISNIENELNSLSGVVLSNFLSLQNSLITTNSNLSTATGTIATLFSELGTATGNISTLFANLATTNSLLTTATGDILSLQYSLGNTNVFLATATGNISTLSGSLGIINSNLVTLTNTLNTTNTNLATATGDIADLFGRVNTLSGSVSTLITNFNTLTTNLNTTNGYLATATGNIATLFSGLATATGNIATLFSNLTTTNSFLATATGDILSLQNNLGTATGNIATLFGNLFSATGDILSLSGKVQNLSGSLSILLSDYGITQSNLSTLSGIVSTKIGLSDLSTTGPIQYNNTTGVFSFFTGSEGQVLAMSGGQFLWINPSIGSSMVNSVFGRTGDILGQTGDYTTNLVTEGSNLYFTDSRARNALSGSIAAITGSLNALSSTVDTLSGTISLINANYTTLTFSVAGIGNSQMLLQNNFNSLSGTVVGIGNNLSTTNSNLASATGNILSLQNSLITTNTNLATATGNINTLFSGLATATGNISTLFTNLSTTNSNLASATGNILSLQTNLASATGNIATLFANLASTTGSLNTVIANLATATGQINTLFTNLSTATGNILSLQTNLATATGNIATLSGLLSTNILNLNSLSGVVSTKIALTNLSGVGPITYNNLTGVFGFLSGSNGQILAMSGTQVVWKNPDASTNLVTSVFGRIGDIIPQSGDYDTTMVTESGSYLYFTDLRAQNALSGMISILQGNIATATGNINTLFSGLTSATGNILSLQANLATATGNIATLFSNLASTTGSLSTVIANLATATGNISTISGSLATLTTNFNTLSGGVVTLSGRVNTLSGSVSTLFTNLAATNGFLATATGNILSLQTNLATATGNISTLSGLINTANTNITSLSGRVNTLSGSVSTLITNFNTLTTNLNTTNGFLATATGNIATLFSGLASATGNILSLQTNLATATGNISTLFTNLSTATGNIATLSGLINTANTNITSLSGRVNTLSGSVSTLFTNLSITNTNLATATGNITTLFSNLTTTNGFLATATGNILSLQTNLATATGNIATLFSGLATATGNISTLFTNLSTTNTNLATATGNIATLFANLASTTGSLNTVIANLATATGQINTLFTNLATATGNISTLFTNLTTATGNIATLSGLLSTNISNLNSLSGVVATKIALTNLSGVGPITYNNTNGQIGINIANTNTTGALSYTDWNIFNNKVGSINGLTGVTQVFAIGNLGNDFNITSIGNTHTFNLPDASGTARGLINTGAQTLTGVKTWSSLQNWNAGGTVGIGQFITFANPGVGNLPGGFNFGLTNDTAQLYAIENTPDNSDYVFKMGDNAEGPGDRYVFWQTSYLGVAEDRWPLVMNSQYAAFNPRFTGNTATGTMTQATMYMNYQNGNIGIGTITPGAKLDIYDNTSTTGTLLRISGSGMTMSGNYLQITGTGGRNLLRVSQNGSDPLDIERVIIGQGGIAASKPDSLARDQLYVFGRINTSWDHFAADFLNSTTFVTADSITPEGLQFDRINTTASYATSNIVGISGTRQIAVNTTANASALVGAYTVTQAGLSPVYEARAIINTSNLTTRAIVGFTDRAINALTLNIDTTNSTNQVFFRKLAASTTWQAVTRSTANAVEVTTPTTVPVNQWNIFRIEVEGSNQTARFYINGNLVATHNGNTVPASTTRLGHQIGLGITNTTANTMDIDYIRVWSDDPASTGIAPKTAKGVATQAESVPAEFSGSSLLPAFIYTSKQYLGDIAFILDKIGNVNSGTLANNMTLGDDGSVTIEQYGNYVLNNLKESLEKLSGIRIDTLLSVQSLETESIDTKNLFVDELCIGGVCISSGTLQSIIESRDRESLPVQNTYNTYTTVTTETGVSTLSVADRAILDGLGYVEGVLIPQFEFYFQKTVTFARDVIFQSRVIFSDPDMAGQALIREGSTEVRVTFDRPYADIPVITVTPVGHFRIGSVIEATRYGFVIEVEQSSNKDLYFNWVALMVQGKGRGYTPPRIAPVVPETPPTVPEVIVSGEMIPEDIPVSQEIPPIETPEQNPSSEDIPTESGSTQLPDVPLSDLEAGAPTDTGSILEPSVPEGENPPEISVNEIPTPETLPESAPSEVSLGDETVSSTSASTDPAPVEIAPEPEPVVESTPFAEPTIDPPAESSGEGI